MSRSQELTETERRLRKIAREHRKRDETRRKRKLSPDFRQEMIHALLEHAKENQIKKTMIAQLIGVNLREVYRWEKGINYPRNLAVIERIQTILTLAKKKPD